MELIGLTGGIGMGKTTAAEVLARRGIPVVDTDGIARDLVQPGTACLAEIKRVFGADIVDAGGKLRRGALARLVFPDEAARRQLEEILHPRIRERWMAQAREWREQGAPTAVVVIPLLFETDAASHFDRTVCVACSLGTQRLRLGSRGWSEFEINQRIAAQWPVERKMEASDLVVWSEGGKGVLEEQWGMLLHEIPDFGHRKTG